MVELLAAVAAVVFLTMASLPEVGTAAQLVELTSAWVAVMSTAKPQWLSSRDFLEVVVPLVGAM